MTKPAEHCLHDETRCACGRLLARLTDAGIELKCSRCRRLVVIEWARVPDDRSHPTDR
jgi:phage FluMu protein Com